MQRTCFVVMPFGGGGEYKSGQRESNYIFERIIRPAVEGAVAKFQAEHGDFPEHQMEIIREVHDTRPGDITTSIIRHVAEAYITIVDLTGRNANVFFELGVRYGLRRNGTILLIQRDQIDKMPFNVRNFRAVEYDPLFEGAEEAKTALQETVLTTLKVLSGPNPYSTDSLVFQALSQLKVTGLGFTEEAPEAEVVSWDEYWHRITHVEDCLNQLRASGVYEPDLIIGISNGGLLLADTTLRLVYGNKLPTICLWAKRSQEKYFDNPINNALIRPEVIEEILQQKDRTTNGKINIMVLDDIVGTQRTFRNLLEYLKVRLGSMFDSIDIKFVFLFTSRKETLEDLKDFLLSQEQRIAAVVRDADFEKVTRKLELPYRKNIPYGSITQAPSAEDSDKLDGDIVKIRRNHIR